MSAASSPDEWSLSGVARGCADAGRQALAWCRREPLGALVVAGILATLIYFFGFHRVFLNGMQSTAEWAFAAWNSENDLEHGWVIFPAALFIAWWHRKEMAAAPKSTSPLGLIIAILGVLTFVFSVRTIQGRFAIFSLPLIIYGSVRFLWGRETARIIVFPCVFLLFMVPLGFLVSRTVALQNLSAAVAAKLAAVFGVHVIADGAALRALDGSFNFEVNGGCSGIRSLTAMTMLAALYVHFTQRELWKKGVIFCCSLFFALLGNFMRIFSVVLFARYINVQVAATIYHDWSGFIFFPIAVGSMLALSNLLNRDWEAIIRASLQPETAAPGTSTRAAAASTSAAAPAGKGKAPAKKAAPSPISYDY